MGDLREEEKFRTFEQEVAFEAERRFLRAQCTEARKHYALARASGDLEGARRQWEDYLRGAQMLLDLAYREEQKRKRR